MSYSLAQIRNGTGFEKGVQFVVATPASRVADDLLTALELAQGRLETDCPDWIVQPVAAALSNAGITPHD